MKIGFWINRLASFKTMGGLIDEALRSDDVILYYDQLAIDRSDAKSYLAPLPEKFPTFYNGEPRKVAAKNIDHLVHQAQQDGVDAIVIHQGYHLCEGDSEMASAVARGFPEIGVKVISLENHFYDHVITPLKAFELFDALCITSHHSRELHLRLLREELNRDGSNPPIDDLIQYYDAKAVITGCPTFDQIPLVDPESVRTKYGIPKGRKVVIFFAPFLNVGDHWRTIVASATSIRSRLRKAVQARRFRYIPSVLLGDTIAEVGAAIRRFCDRENATLILKSRGKQTGLETIASTADIFVNGYDDEYYPTFASYELMAMADLCIQTYSYSALEAVIAAKPTLCIATPRDLPITEIDWREKMQEPLVKNDHSGGLFNYPGCVYSTQWKRAVRYLDHAKLTDFSFDAGKKEEYVKRFTGVEHETSAARILRTIYKVSGYQKGHAELEGSTLPLK